jgi:phage-related protein
MKSIGKGVREIRLRQGKGAYRVLYIAGYIDAIYILHAFEKKTQSTAQKDLDLAKSRYKTLTQDMMKGST